MLKYRHRERDWVEVKRSLGYAIIWIDQSRVATAAPSLNHLKWCSREILNEILQKLWTKWSSGTRVMAKVGFVLNILYWLAVYNCHNVSNATTLTVVVSVIMLVFWSGHILTFYEIWKSIAFRFYGG